MADYYPPLGFHFKVEFNAFPGEYAFQSVAGLSVEMETEQIAEGGENRFKHKVPVRSKYPKLVLKRGLLVDSEIIRWCRNALENFEFEPTDLIVKLLNEEHQPLMTWNVVHAYPVKWSISDFDAEKNQLVIETLELNYNYFNVM
ncbi:phage tail protein [uncultured Draconibacterium sp.]|uniref:phage tail protein n=1 Tax=uncultured Draconibacterium sp. TaxID=1573823 RepID=UPI0025EA01AB|nr:phage tail protein [uncultured Draconibacterium sp.]